MFIPPILHAVSTDRTLSPAHAAHWRSWQRMHPSWEHCLWSVAEGAAFVRQHLPWLAGALESAPSKPALVRLALLYLHGGMAVDLDFECLRPASDLVTYREVAVSTRPAEGGPAGLSDAMVISTRQSSFLRGVLEQWHGRVCAAEALDRALAAYPCPSFVALLPPGAVRSAPDGDDGPFVEQGTYAVRRRAPRELPAVQARPPGLPERLPAGLIERGKALARFDVTEDPSAGPAGPVVSALMVTRGRPALALRAVRSFLLQTYPRCELVVVDDDPDDTLARALSAIGDPRIRHVRLPDERRSLGELRNISVENARGEYVCQWDDDDLSDPLRLAVQLGLCLTLRAGLCLAMRERVWWPGARRLVSSRYRFWEGSFLAHRDVLPKYEPLRAGEDVPFTHAMIERGRTAMLDWPEMYLYTFHGKNTWDAEHFDFFWQTATERFEGEAYDRELARMTERMGPLHPRIEM